MAIKTTTKQTDKINFEQLYEKCYKIYEEDGQDAVIDYCNSIGYTNYGRCNPCDSLNPVGVDKYITCLVCGHSTHHDNA